MKIASTSIDHIIDEHIHSPSLVYPTLAAGIVVTSAAGAWNLSAAFVPVVAAGVITERFDIHHISLELLSANAVYELHLFWGVANTFAGSCRFTKNAVMDGTQNAPMQTIVIPAGSQIDAKIADSAGASAATISLFYHTYD